jgi:uracil-DNA glycosylase family 4
MILAEGPSVQDDRTGRPFTGKIGEELDRFLNGVDLPTREDVFLTYLYRQYGGKRYVYTSEDLERDEPFLLDDLQKGLPTTIVTLGRAATRFFLGDVDMDAVEGIPFYLPETCTAYPCAPDNVVIFPITHPNVPNPEMLSHVVTGFQELARYASGDLDPRKLFDDPYGGRERYVEITSMQELQGAFSRLRAGVPLSEDTEGWPGNPWSLQFSFEPGTGYLIDAKRTDLLHAYNEELRRRDVTIVFHSALHDRMMRRAMGIPWHGAFEDTMVESYLLQLEPQGLKQSCLRHCNMKMDSYDDIMGDKTNELAREYLTWIYEAEQTDYEEAQRETLCRLQTTPYTDARGKVHAGRKVRKLPSLPKTPLHKASLRILSSKRPRKLWDDQVEDVQVAGYNRMGRIPEATLDYVERPKAIGYGCRDADGTTRLLPEYSRRIDSLGLRAVYELELSTYPIIDRMQQVGLLPDLAHFAALSERLEGEIVRLRTDLGECTGRPLFNANSGDQVADYLFGDLGLEEMKMTSSGRGSTNDKILEALEHEHPEHPEISTIREYRETYKLKNTFVDRLPDFVDRWPYDGRIHSTFRTTRVVTGRLAASDPNVLAQPEHGKFAPDFKRGWVAAPGHVVCQWDYSQAELRGLAHLSQDPVMCAIFRGEMRNPDGSMIDLHAALAERIFGVKPKDQDKHKHRLPAKAVNFGIPMGMTCKGLSVELRKNGVDADEDTAQRWLDETLSLYKGVARYMEERKAEARRNGYIRCLSGRIRYVGGIRSRNERTREEAERFAFSTPIQESATYIIKQAEAAVYEDILIPWWGQGRWVEPLLQVHDCLKLEVEEGLQHDLNVLMRNVMIHTPQTFSVPMDVDGSWGPNMYDMEDF